MSQSLILEIRAGTGGGEAALFAAGLLRMYKKYAEGQGFRLQVINEDKDGLGGIKNASLSIGGENAFQKLKNEAGVHRVQRVPKTEKSGRIHTSTATVAILGQEEEAVSEINPQDLRFEFFRAASHGGQNVNKVETAVRITHLPSGISASSQEERSQFQNRERALGRLKKILQYSQAQKLNQERQEERREQIGMAERSEKIRTYNFPQDRVTDHRINKSFGNIEGIMNGRLEKIIEALGEN